MYFDLSHKKIGALLTLGFILAGAVSVSLIALSENRSELTHLAEITARTRSELSYLLFFKFPSIGEGGLASADAAMSTTTATSIPVLLYHGEGASASTMATSVFVDQMRTLKAAGWHTVTLAQFESFMQGKTTLPDKSFLLTFDDGRRDTFYAVDPVLKDLDFTGVMFVITGFSMPDNGPTAMNNFYLSKDELAYMEASGRWELESHGDEDHREYTVPHSLAATASTSQMDSGQHFVSNRFFLPEKSRVETLTEYEARIAGDLTTSKKILEEDFGSPVTAYAYPFNDFGEDTDNFPASAGYIARAVQKEYPYAFYQTWAGDGDSFNYPNANAFMIKRIEPLQNWSGDDLLAALMSGRAKALPYVTSDFSEGWQTNWGAVTEGPSLSLAATPDTTGAAAFLDGTEYWKDYALSVSARGTTGTLSLVARHTEADAPYLVCAFSDDRIYLERHDGETQTTIASAAYHPANTIQTVSMTVRSSSASCSAAGISVRGTAAGIPARGGVGATVWDPEPGTARAELIHLSATKS